MKNVLLGYKRSNGEFKGKDDKVIAYDNVNIMVGKVDDFGNGIAKVDTYKLKTEQFEDITNMSFEDFEANFTENFFGHECSVLGTIEYERFQVSDVTIDPAEMIFSFSTEAIQDFTENKEKLIKK